MVRLLAAVLVALGVSAIFAWSAVAAIGKGVVALPPDRAECLAYNDDVTAGRKQPRRIALSIGNANYPSLGRLSGTVSDSKLVAETLKEFGWEVAHKVELDREQMAAALERFAEAVEQLCRVDVALLYFAGSGFEINRTAYIIPVDAPEVPPAAEFTAAREKAYLDNMVNLAIIAESFRLHKGPKLIILDTCRTDPFESIRAEALATGPAPKLPDNTLYAFAAEPGETASDVGPDGRHGPYAFALARAIREVQGSAEQVFRRVRKEVAEFGEKTGSKQQPFVESTLTADVFLGRPPETAPLVDTARQSRKRSAGGSGASRAAAAPAKRIALVIANGDYASAGVLKNPANDAKAVAASLRKLGFDVYEKKDLKHTEVEVALIEFGKQARKAEWAMIYFAGHGMEIAGRTYLLPVDVKLERDLDADDEAVRLEKIIERVERTEGIGLIVLDACRNNPFERSMRITGRRGRDARTGSGLGRIELDEAGVLVAYSARHGTVALDGDGELSPFAEALLQWLDKPGVEIDMVFRKVRDEVFRKTQGRQQPFSYGSLPGREYYLVPPRASAPPSAVTATAQ